jgi:hypothetical protein
MMPIVKYVLIVLFLTNYAFAAVDDCYFGENCLLSCHCDDEEGVPVPCDSRTGKCPSGSCGYTKLWHLNDRTPIKIPWNGPSCQIGNVALNKDAYQVKTFGQFKAEGAVNGLLGTHLKAAHPDSHDNSIPAWWMVDLGTEHKIYNVTVYNTFEGWGNPDIMADFDIKIGHSKDIHTHETCATHVKVVPVNGHVTLTCEGIGRYVSYQRHPKGFVAKSAILSEVVVIGEPYYEYNTDCSKCEETCTDSKQYCGRCTFPYVPPNCKDVCPDDNFINGSKCQSCGGCAEDVTCDPHTGFCPKGCSQWFVPRPFCNIELVKYQINHEPTVITAKADELTISFEKATIPENVHKNYYYGIAYKKNTEESPMEGDSSVTVTHAAPKNQISADNLAHNTEYKLFLTLMRTNNGVSEKCDEKIVIAKTDCIPPVPPLLDVEQLDDGNVKVTYQLYDSGCDNIAGVFLYYKDATHQTWVKRLTLNATIGTNELVMTMNPDETRQYKLRVFNNGNKDIESVIREVRSFSAGALASRRRVASEAWQVPFRVVMAAVAGVILLAIVAFFGVKCWRRRHTGHMNLDNGNNNSLPETLHAFSPERSAERPQIQTE